MKKYKKDIAIVLILLVFALVFFLIFHLVNNKTAASVEIYREDTLIKTYSFDENGKYDIKLGENYNQIIIENGSVFMKDADCPDKLCIKQGSISKSGESIICLPHKIVVKISSKED